MVLKPARVLVSSDDAAFDRAVVRAFRGEEVLALPKDDYDTTSWDTARVIKDWSPNLVIDLASKREESRERAFELNYSGTQNVALACKAAQASLVYLSTSSVFEGNGDGPRKEYETPQSKCVWGMSKGAGEQVVRQTLHEFYIVRTSWLFGDKPQKFTTAEIVAGCESSLVGNATYVVDLAAALSQLVRSGRYGVYHLMNEGSSTLREFLSMTQSLLSDGMSLSKGFPLDLESIDPAESGAMLCNSTAASQLGLRLRHWNAALIEHLTAMRGLVG
jgi:dTDP-4-dehydrorhamnose reductase